tara:strand:- start:684 stop:1142 length:459 start_codon:yes stop_codon:yes gene_type:complete
MFKTFLILFISALMIFMPMHAMATELEGTVTSLKAGQKAPYAGILLDSIAASKMIVEQKYLRAEIELELTKKFQQDLASKRLAYDLLKVEYDTLKNVYEQTTLIKEKQISQLQNSLREEASSSKSNWALFGGVVVGIALSIAVFYASVEIAK